jgi:plastocyanin
MMKLCVPSARRPLSWMLLSCLGLLLLAFAACGSGNGSTSGSSSASNNANSRNASVMTIAIKEGKGADGQDIYYFDPASITLHQGDTITIQNLSDELQDVDQGDAEAAGIDVVIPLNQSGTVTFNKVGTFTIKSEKGATITVTVQ